MQVNPIAQLTAAPSAAPAGHDEPSADKGFAKLLGDADTKSSHEQNRQSLPGNEPKSAVLAAQEVVSDSGAAPIVPSAPLDALVSLLGRRIDANEAKAILDKFSAMSQNGERHDPAFDQLKEALEDIAGGGEVTDVVSMLEALPEVADAQPQERAPVLQRLLGWVSAAIDKHKEAPVAGAMPDGTVQSLQATLFPAGHDAAQSPAKTGTKTEREEKITDISQVIPDAAPTTTDAAPVTAIDTTVVVATVPVAVFVPTTQSSTMPEWVKKLGEGEENIAAEAVNEAIPPLALSEEDETLPVVSLPGSEDSVILKAEPKVASRNFSELLENTPIANDNIEQQAAPVVTVDADGIIAAPQAPSTHNSSSLTPITVSAHAQLMPHVAAAEQVHVAITSMKKDGIDSITLQLEPADLGRVEIKMDTVDGRTQVSFLVDKAETLDALSRDARSLERQLQEAGVRADAGSMQFNLRQQPQQEMADDAKGSKNSGIAGSLEEAAAVESAVTNHYTLNVKEGVDIHA